MWMWRAQYHPMKMNFIEINKCFSKYGVISRTVSLISGFEPEKVALVSLGPIENAQNKRK